MPSTPCAERAHGANRGGIPPRRTWSRTTGDVMSAADTAPPRHEERGLGRVLRRQQACGSLDRLLTPATRQLTLVGSSLTRLDVYGALVIRAAVDVHLHASTSHSVALVEPVNDETWALLFDLLGQSILPSRCAWAGTRAAPARGRRVLVPVTAIDDPEAAQLLHDVGLPAATRALRYGDAAARILQEAAAVFLDNAAIHGRDSPIAPLVSASLEAQGNDLQLAVLDLGARRPSAGEEADALQAALRRSRDQLGSLHSLTRQRGGIQMSVRVAWGTGRANFRSGGSWRYTEGTDLPGFMAGLEIHR